MKQHFLQFPEKRTGYTNFFSEEFPVYLTFLLEFLVEWFAFQKFNNFLLPTPNTHLGLWLNDDNPLPLLAHPSPLLPSFAHPRRAPSIACFFPRLFNLCLGKERKQLLRRLLASLEAFAGNFLTILLSLFRNFQRQGKGSGNESLPSPLVYSWLYILIPIALFSSLSRRSLGTRIEGLWRQDFQVLDSRTSSLHVCSCDVSIYCMGLKMAAFEAGFEESLFQALN